MNSQLSKNSTQAISKWINTLSVCVCVSVRVCVLVRISFFLNEFTWTFMLMHAENHPNNTSSQFWQKWFSIYWSHSDGFCRRCCPRRRRRRCYKRQYANTNTTRKCTDTIQSKKQRKKLDFNSTYKKKKIAWKKERARQLKRKKDLSGGKICE